MIHAFHKQRTDTLIATLLLVLDEDENQNRRDTTLRSRLPLQNIASVYVGHLAGFFNVARDDFDTLAQRLEEGLRQPRHARRISTGEETALTRREPRGRQHTRVLTSE
eukprot:GILK01008122.1.p1 GENE.GILK01008122.1~~GILK01008122.1.p1  ORF type:complete len:108 (-),score=6.42 GILK01008122.1:299-622(-)